MKLLGRILLISFITLVLLEIALQIHNPFPARVKNGQVLLPVNAKYHIKLPDIPGLDSEVVHVKNSLGFRGEELTDSTMTKIICMGGSTTECFYLNEGKDWPAVLAKKLKEDNPNYWLNNAGMDGQSSFGNMQMLKQYILKIKPNYIILMCGLNDMSLKKPSKFDTYEGKWYQKLYNKLELPSTIVNLLRAEKAKDAGLNHQYFKDIRTADTLHMNDSQISKRLTEESKYLPAYKDRLKNIIHICKANHIKLILVSQSILFSNETDLMTNTDLGLLKTGEINGLTRSYILRMYNRATFEVADKENIPFINLSARLPNDSRFFYDGYHFTNDGAELTAEILYDEISKRNLIKPRKKK